MVRLKTLDFYTQLLLIIVIALMYAFDSGHYNALPLIVTLGLIQVISITTHLLTGPRTWKSGLRKIHHVLTIGVIVMILIGFAIPGKDKYDSGGAVLVIYAIFPAILLTIFYTIISGIELALLKKETAARLKERSRLF
jgi:hypothetical protein